MHTHLQRQLRKLRLSPDAPPDGDAWRALLAGVSRSYEDADRERYTLERSITLSSAEMQDLNARLMHERDQFAHVFQSAPVGILRIELDGRVTDCNPAFEQIAGVPRAALTGMNFWQLSPAEDQTASRALFFSALSAGTARTLCQVRLVTASGGTLVANLGLGLVFDNANQPLFVIAVAEDVTEKVRLEIELRHAQKLESVGRLAAGIAHEINTPIQFVGDNVSFLSAAFDDVLALYDKCHEMNQHSGGETGGETERQWLREEEERADLAYVRQNVPAAFQATLDGVRRVSRIVQSMKAFAHPERGSSSGVDLNAAISSTVTVATNELKYVADVVLELGTLPPVTCYVGDLNQVFVNLLVNAAHAVADRVAGTEGKGTVRVRSYADGGDVVVGISDTGTGIAEGIRAKVFDPFFTTKEVGRGTGQGLALSRSVVVEQHGGTLTFETELGQGTTFYVRLPISGPRPIRDAGDSKQG